MSSRGTGPSALWVCVIVGSAIITFAVLILGPSQLPYYLFSLILVVFICYCAKIKANEMVEDSVPVKKIPVPRDPNQIRRVVVNPYTGKEHIITGKGSETFREACLNDWPFESIDPSKEWIIRDERGNDITNRQLQEYDAIAHIESTAPFEDRTISDESKTSDDAAAEYSDINMGVEFYD